MTLETRILKAQEFVENLLENKLQEGFLYHSIQHTRDVVEVTQELAEMNNLSGDELEIVMLAAWLHDTGYTESYENHEEASINIARSFLTNNNYKDSGIDKITECIEATKMPQSPKNLLSEIICDADLASLGRKNYFAKSELIRQEWKERKIKDLSKKEWIEYEIDFLSNHTYFTNAAKLLFDTQKADNIKKLRAMKENEPANESNAPHSSAAQKKKRK